MQTFNIAKLPPFLQKNRGCGSRVIHNFTVTCAYTECSDRKEADFFRISATTSILLRENSDIDNVALCGRRLNYRRFPFWS